MLSCAHKWMNVLTFVKIYLMTYMIFFERSDTHMTRNDDKWMWFSLMWQILLICIKWMLFPIPNLFIYSSLFFLFELLKTFVVIVYDECHPKISSSKQNVWDEYLVWMEHTFLQWMNKIYDVHRPNFSFLVPCWWSRMNKI